MSDLSVSYLGINLKNPIVVAASTFSSNIDSIKQIEGAGAGALVVRSLFEEQIMHEVGQMEEALASGSEAYAEALSYMPMLEHAGAREHLMWVEKTREAVDMPLIGSVNAVSAGKWTDYAKQFAETGVNALELNVYAVEADPALPGADVEKRLFDMFEAVKAVVDIPIAVKLSPYYSSIANVVTELEKRGAAGVVLFNRFLQPDIDVENETALKDRSLSSAAEMRLPLRWIGLLHGRVGLDLIANTGVETPEDVVKYLLAGATGVQVASALYRFGIDHLSTLIDGLDAWMKAKGYHDLAAFRGKVSQRDQEGSLHAFERAQYVDFILSQKD
jgi:dihydroorotate dehydrogenase (fumarate)